MTARSHSMLHRRPPTPDSTDSSEQQDVPPLPNISSRSISTSQPPRRTPLGFLRRSKSGDPVRKMAPVVSHAPPKLPNLPINGSSNTTNFPRHLFGKDIRDSAEHLSSGFDQQDELSVKNPQIGRFVPGRKSTDSVIGPSGEYVKSSSLPISEDPYANIGSMAHRGRYSPFKYVLNHSIAFIAPPPLHCTSS